MPTNIESFSGPRDNLPNVYTNVTPRELDFVTQFGRNWDALRQILGIMNPVKKVPGTRLISYTTTVALESGSVPAGAVIPYSKATTVQAAHADLTLEKYAKGVPIEEIDQYGAAIAIQRSDEEFRNALQTNVLTRFYTFLNTGTLTDVESTWQAALAKAKGLVLDKFNKLRRNVTNVVGFANVLDFYDYLGAAQVTVQTQFGLTYVQNFMGYSTLFLLSAPDINRGDVIAVPASNIVLYYADPGDADYQQGQLQYTVAGETNLIGFHAQGNYNTATSESFAIMGMALWAEYLDGIAVVSMSTDTTAGSATFTSGAGTTAGTKITVTAPTLTPDMSVYVKAQASTAPSVPAYKGAVDSTWTEIKPDLTTGVADNVTGFTAGHKMVMAITNGAGQTIYAESSGVSVVNKS